MSPRALTIRLLGAPELGWDDKPVNAAATRAIPLVALLACAPGRVPRERIAALLWRRVEPGSALASLRQLLHHLPGPLREAISADRTSLALDRDQVDCDLWRLGPEAAAHELLGAYRGPLLGLLAYDDFPEFDDWLRLERAQLSARVRQAVETAMDNASPDDALALAERWLRLEPGDEAIHARAISLHLDAGRHASAEAQFDHLRRHLATTAGRAPQAATRALMEQAAMRRGAPRGVGIPAIATSFVGRQPELAELARLAADPHCRLITLHGPGGVGKTRIAMAFAEEAARHGDAIHFAGLEAAQTLQAMYASLAAALGVELSPRQAPRVRLLEALRAHRGLVVVDNLEQLLTAGAGERPEAAIFLAELLRAAPGVKLLATSRVALGLQEEWLVAVGGLPYPEGDSPAGGASTDVAIELFVSRARQAYRGFSGSAERPHILAICRAADGLPLALELAAAQVGSRPCAEIARALLDEPERRAINRPDRQASVLRVIEQSLGAASAEQAGAFASLALFQSMFTDVQAFEVARVGEGMLRELAGRALLQRSGEHYRMHPLLRQVALKRLQRRRAVARRVEGGYVAAIARRAGAEHERMLGREAPASLATIAERFDDELAALRLAAFHGDARHVELLAAALVQVGVARGLIGACLAAWPDPAQAGLPAGARASLLIRRGDFNRHSGNFVAAEADYAEAGRALEGHEAPGLRFALRVGTSGLQVWRGQYAEAVATCEAALAMDEGCSTLAARTRLAASLGTALAELGEHERAQALLDAATARALEAGLSASVLALVLNASGGVAQYRGDLVRCVAVHRQALALLEADGFRQMRPVHLCNLAGALHDLGDLDGAAAAYEQAIGIAAGYGDRGPLTYSLVGLANIHLAHGDTTRAAHTAQEAFDSARASGSAALAAEAATILVRAAMRQGDRARARVLLVAQERETRGQVLGFRRLDVLFSALQLAALGGSRGREALLARAAHALVRAPECTSSLRRDVEAWVRANGLPEANAEAASRPIETLVDELFEALERAWA